MIVSNEQRVQHLSYVKGTVSAFVTKDWRTQLYFGQPLIWPRHEMGTFGNCNIMLNSVRQHNCFITQDSYIGYMFRLLISLLQAYSSQLSHKTLCTHWDTSVFTSMEYIILDNLPQQL